MWGTHVHSHESPMIGIKKDVGKYGKQSAKGTEYILTGREVVTRRRGDLKPTDNKAGGWKFSKIKYLMNYKYSKTEKKECMYS